MPQWQELNDDQLIDRTQQGELGAFGVLYERHVQSVYRFLYVRMNDRLDAEDLTEEVFLRVWRSIDNYQTRGVPFLAFLFRVARNALIDHYRASSNRNQEVDLEESPLPDSGVDPSERVFTNLEHQRIKEVMDRLSDDYRDVLALRFFSGLSSGETAKVMDRSTGAVRVLQHRALNALRELLDEGTRH